MVGKRVSFVLKHEQGQDIRVTGTVEALFVSDTEHSDSLVSWLLISYDGAFYERPSLECAPTWP